jgi:hypothetical protein
VRKHLGGARSSRILAATPSREKEGGKGEFTERERPRNMETTFVLVFRDEHPRRLISVNGDMRGVSIRVERDNFMLVSFGQTPTIIRPWSGGGGIEDLSTGA